MSDPTPTAPIDSDALDDSPDSPHHHGDSIPLPEAREERDRLLAAVRDYASAQGIIPPLTLGELETHADRILAGLGQDNTFRVFVMVLLYNESWRAAFSAIPFNKRILLLPPCMRSRADCPAEFDELGLICERCGKCDIGPLVEEAEALGYAVLVAEGTSTVTALIETGQMQAALGASCMAALEHAFPRMAEKPVPSLAIPLTKDGCNDTTLDIDWLREALRSSTGQEADIPLDLVALHGEVSEWFTQASLREALELGDSPTEKIGLEWLATSGKRWRPFLMMSVCRAFGDTGDGRPEASRRVAIAVESIHKASLVYDDMQDHDVVRYGKPTVHEVHGIPLALNVGLDLLGHGYRLIAESGAPSQQTADMLSLATRGHCTLCVGQGDELCWAETPEPLGVDRVLEMFRLKTAPSFVVVVGLGAILGGADRATRDALYAYSEALGLAYQIKDDLDDFREEGDVDDVKYGRASLTLTVAYEEANEEVRSIIGKAWSQGATPEEANAIRAMVAGLGAEERVVALLNEYRDRALKALRPLTNAQLKILLHRIAGKILKSDHE